ncbi:MAG: ATP-grasp domain-containing protein [Gammaproteobacteria bacterium]|nr:ATP-grasp domain-containing protein [Gammaproteobacteria bacterium]
MVVADRTKPRLLVVAPFGSYRSVPFLEAVRAVGVTPVFATEGKSALVESGVPGLRLPFADPARCISAIREEIRRHGPFAAVLGLDDWGAEIAGTIAAELGLAANAPAALATARRKDRARAALAAAGVRVPWHQVIPLDTFPTASAAQAFPYPLVIKPVSLSASRGVMRVDTPETLYKGLLRLVRLLDSCADPGPRVALAEAFIPGQEVALEGLLTDGCLETLALFDKPEPLDGPFFEETYYITPSRLPAVTQEAIRREVESGARAYGLREGPVHAECRINAQGVFIIEIAARTIGGLCGRLLRFGLSCSLEEVIVRHALREPVTLQRQEGASGVLMIPVPAAGILRRVEGLMAADRVPGVIEVVIDVREGQELVPLPEGSSYVGFIFARAPTFEAVFEALKTAHAHLRFVVSPSWRVRTTA